MCIQSKSLEGKRQFFSCKFESFSVHKTYYNIKKKKKKKKHTHTHTHTHTKIRSEMKNAFEK